MKIIHTADIHFDTPFSGLDAKKAEIRREDIRKTFSALIELVKTENADCLIIAGDLFDSKNVSKMTLDFIISKFSEISDAYVLISAGNHDPKSINSYYNLINWGENVHVFDTKPEVIDVKGVSFCGVSFDKAVCDDALISEEFLQKEKTDVLVMHANLCGNDYNPISRDFIVNSGVRYFASGHIHKQYAEKIGDTFFCYPGCLEGRGFDELGIKGAFVVSIEENAVKSDFVPLSKREYIEKEINISGVNSNEEIIGKIFTECKIEEKNLYKIILTGECDFHIDTNILLDSICVFNLKIVDKTIKPLDLSKVSNDYSIQGIFVKKMLSRMEKEGETEELKRALSYGLSAIRGEKVNP